MPLVECNFDEGGKRRLVTAHDMLKREIIILPGRDGVVSAAATDAENLRGRQSIGATFKAIEAALQDIQRQDWPHISCWEYGTAPDDATIIEGLRAPDRFESPEARQFVETVLLPRLFAGEERPDASIVAGRMDRITFDSHSYGAQFAQQICNVLRERLADHRYSKVEIERICHAGVLISTAGAGIMQTKEPQFTSLHFRAITDQYIQSAMRPRALWLLNQETEDGHDESSPAHEARLKKLLHDTGYASRSKKLYAAAGARVAHVLAPLSDSIQWWDGTKARTTDRSALGDMIGHALAVHRSRDLEVKQGEFDNNPYIDMQEAALKNAIARDGSKTAAALLGAIPEAATSFPPGYDLTRPRSFINR